MQIVHSVSFRRQDVVLIKKKKLEFRIFCRPSISESESNREPSEKNKTKKKTKKKNKTNTWTLSENLKSCGS